VSTDLELARRCQEGDVQAFETVYRRHAGRLYTLAVRMAGSAQEAEDLLQEVFLNAYRKMGSYRGEASLGTWLYRLSINHCLDHRRSRRVRQARITDSLDADGAPEPAAQRGTMLSAVSRMDLERAIGQLPDGCRAAFLLHDVEGFEHQEVAVILGIATGTSKSQVHKARLRLRHLLAQPHGGDA
jgi:RNA polymerase sigma-70 factor (ECF subfamily)